MCAIGVVKKESNDTRKPDLRSEQEQQRLTLGFSGRRRRQRLRNSPMVGRRSAASDRMDSSRVR
jgi:hypothetical protein